jgi:predicted membrane protein
MLAFWSMSAGYVRGVGFTPRNRLLKLLFSTTTCLLALLAAVIVMRPWI